MTGTSLNSRWTAAAGIGFAVSVVVQNAWAGAAGVSPANDAGAAEIVAAFADNAGANGILAAWVAANLVLIGVFLAGARNRLHAVAPGWADLGVVGGILLMALFAMLNVPRIALALGAERLAGEPALVDVLWDAHLATFGYAGVALGLALLGFSLAAVAAGMVPSWFRVAGPVGAAVIIGFSVPVQAVADGAEATMAGGLGFLVWLVFLIVFGIRLWREAPATPRS